jgi:sulfane dehydrogenase subunit SoxC
VRSLTNPKLEPRNSAARTPHHLLNGTITPNGLHFVIARGGYPDIDPDKHKLLIHGRVKQPTVFTVEALHRYPMVSRVTFLECGGNSAPLYSKEPIQANVQDAATCPYLGHRRKTLVFLHFIQQKRCQNLLS